MRDQLGYSPDELDSLCCTFAAPVAAEVNDANVARTRMRRKQYEEDAYSVVEETYIRST